MASTRLAVVGAGVIGQRHIAAIQAHGNAVLTAVVDTNPHGAQLAQSLGVAFFSDTETMLATEKPDGVIVATPTEHHLQPTLAALAANTDVLVEKPIAATLNEANSIVETSAANGQCVLVGHHRRYYPVLDTAKAVVRDGSLGQLIAVTGQWNVNKHESYYAPAWRRKRQAGPVLTNLIHEIDTLRYICGEIVAVSAEISHQPMQYDKEDAAALVMRFASRALGTFILSDRTPSPWAWEFATGENPSFPLSAQNVCRFMGTTASLEFPNLTLWRYDDPKGNWQHELQSQQIESTLGDAYVAQIDHFCAVIGNRATPRIDAADATASLRVTLAVFDAAKSGRRVDLHADRE